MKLLVLCDDVWHPAEVIQKGMAYLEDDTYQFNFVCDAKDILTPEMIREYPVVINCKSNNINGANTEPWFEEGVTEVMPRDFETYVREGGSFLAIHAANAYFEGHDDEYIALVGNHFVSHPPRCEVTVKVSDTNHPIADGVGEFTVRDEHYEIGGIAKDAKVFLHSVSDKGGTQVAGYTRTIGKGKVCVLTPGHILAVWQNPEFQKLVRNSIDWCISK